MVYQSDGNARMSQRHPNQSFFGISLMLDHTLEGKIAVDA
jgi:hypothetical protein